MIDFDMLVNKVCHDTFGESVTYYRGDRSPLTVPAVFTEKFTQTTFQDGAEISSTRTALNVRDALLPSEPVKGELFRVRGVLYVVNEVDEGGFGDTRVYLGLASDVEARRLPLPATPILLP